MNEVLGLGLLFGMSFLLCYGLLRWRARRAQAAKRRWVEPDAEGQEPTPLFGAWSEALAAQVPMSQRGKDELKIALRTAGLYKPTALIDYAALRASVVLAALVGTAVACLVVPPEQVRLTLLLGTTAAVLAFSVPRFYLMVRGRRRAREIERGLPFAVDLLALALSAGQNTLAAIARVSREIGLSHPALGEELQIVQRQATLSSLGLALEQLAQRVRIAPVRNLALLLIQSERLGADASAALLEFSQHHRTSMRQDAEVQANRTTFWMMFPSVCCLWVAALLLLIGPLYYEFWRQWGATAQAAKESQQKMREVGGGGRFGPPARPRVEGPVLP
jgi:tight adherence protein C